jgi:hypothetical protein
MKLIPYKAAVLVSALAFCVGVGVHDASAATVSIANQDTINLPPISDIQNPTPTSQDGTVLVNIFGPSFGGFGNGVYRSPFEDYNTQIIPPAYLGSPFTVIGSNGPGWAIYDLKSAQSTLRVLLGSPDSYNLIQFWSLPDLGGILLGSFIGTDFLIQGNGHDLVTFTGGPFQSVYLASTNAALEFAPLSDSATPLPAALPLFATGLGVISYFAARRRRKNMAQASVAA